MWTSVASVRPFDQAAAEQRPTRPVPSQTNRAIALPHWAGASLCIDYSRLLDIARRLHDEPRTWVRYHGAYVASPTAGLGCAPVQQ